MDVALAEEANPPREIPGAAHHPRILEYLRASAAWVAQTDETPWCASFVNFCLVRAGYPGTDNPGARSFFWNKANQFVFLPGPRLNCIGVIRREPFSARKFHDDRWETGAGHVGFVVGHDAETVTLLGGNQADTINRTRYPRMVPFGDGRVDQFVAFLMPAMG